ncbi:MAG: phosphoribosyl-AMP cyclohydrolase [Balneolaceae bacterium]|nr:phosphoribosyl-AMP cyclohydrolase [Balneolaceae bacterium]
MNSIKESFTNRNNNMMYDIQLMSFEKIDIEETKRVCPQFKKRDGILPVAVQKSSTGQILMLASVNEEAFRYSIENKVAAFYSTSRNKLWVKGETSGNCLQLDEVLMDCDQDAFVYKVTLLKGGVCHTLNQHGENRKACFYRALNINKNSLDFLEK